MRLAIVSHRETDTTAALVEAAPHGLHAFQATPLVALCELGAGDAALGRLDVLPTLDGIQNGLLHLDRLEACGIRVLNPACALRLAHDKLATAAALTAAGVPHPRTHAHADVGARPSLSPPVVLKPRFGSWGRDVLRCADRADYDLAVQFLNRRRWFHATGAVVQELVPPLGHDLRVIVAGGTVVGAVRRVAAPGEWRTNVALGARREPVEPPLEARELALAAADAVGGDLVGVDLLPLEQGGYTVLEVNGAVEFSPVYGAGDVFTAAMRALVRVLGRELVAA